MDITRITANNYEAFEDVLPDDYFPGDDRLAFGAVTGNKEAISSIIIDPYDDSFVYIDWLYTDPNFREQGAASELLDMVSIFLREMSVGRMLISFDDEYEDLELFLEDRGFAIYECSDVYRVPVTEIIYGSRMDELLEKKPGSNGVFTIEEGEMLQKFLSFASGKNLGRDFLSAISREYSLVMLDEDREPVGCMIIRETEDEDLEMVYLLNTSGRSRTLDLIVGFYEMITANNLDDRDLFFSDPEGIWTGIVENLIGDDIEKYRVEGLLEGISIL